MKTPFMLAPMAGITDAPMRRICSSCGASLVFTEMVSGKGLFYNGKKTRSLLKMYPDEQPVGIQIFGSDEEIMAFAARELESYDNPILDLNLGCPVPKVVKNGEGSALLKDPDRAAGLIKVLTANTSKHVTAKIRIGWDKDNINAVEVAQKIEAAGASAITVHGRTRDQYYTGCADWDEIRKVKKSVSIPVTGSGDIFSGIDAVRMLEMTGCDGVMIARGALGNPWIFEEANNIYEGREVPVISTGRKMDMLMHHFDMIEKEKGEKTAVLEIRKFAAWYLKGIPNASAFRGRLNELKTSADLHDEIADLRNKFDKSQ